jgi:hypothetical protein
MLLDERRRKLQKIIVLLALSIGIAASVLGDCKCAHPAKGETTHWGGNQLIVVVDKNPHKQLRGTIEEGADDTPIEGALVEIFIHPEYLREKPLSGKSVTPQRRVGVCRTADDSASAAWLEVPMSCDRVSAPPGASLTST